jgi:hypothetical protein
MHTKRNVLKLSVGLAIGAAFVYLALRDVDPGRMRDALMQTDLRYVALAVALMMLSHYLRAMRWGVFLAPVKPVGTAGLFSALMIGYAANTFVPAHLGEFLRAAVTARKQGIPAGAALASIVIERIVDVISLIGVMALVFWVHPFPQWVVHSGYVMLGGAFLALAALAGCKRYESLAGKLLRLSLKPFPAGWRLRIENAGMSFLAGIMPLGAIGRYAAAAFLSLAIWICYAGVYYACLVAFDLVAAHLLAWYVGLVVLVFTTVSVVIPSTPGYVGTFHYLCQTALVMFGVSSSEALSYAVVAHLVGVVPVTAAGLIFANREGIAIRREASASQQALKGGR